MDLHHFSEHEQMEALLNQYIFYPEKTLWRTPADIGLPYETIWLRTEDGVRIHGWLIPHIDAPATILFFHGNAGTIADRLDNARLLYEAGWQIFLLDYRGFGRSEGTPSEQGTYRDARAVWEWARTELRGYLVLFGRSLGGAVAIWLAAQEDVTPTALIVENTFTRGRDITQQVLPIPGLAHLLPDFYPSIDRIKRITCPKLIIHGEEDELIPVEHGRRLYEAAPPPKDLYLVPGGHHNDTWLVGGQAYLDRLSSFINSAIGEESSHEHA